jgi:hypothetical protein
MLGFITCRCKVPRINPETGEEGDEPTETLQKFRCASLKPLFAQQKALQFTFNLIASFCNCQRGKGMGLGGGGMWYMVRGMCHLN